MKRPLFLCVAFGCSIVASCRPAKKSAKTRPVARTSDIVWIQIRGADVRLPNKDKEEWDIREAVVWQTLLELAAHKPPDDFTYFLSFYRLGKETRPDDAGFARSSIRHGIPDSRVQPPPPPPPPPAPIPIQPPLEFLQRFSSQKTIHIKPISEARITADGTAVGRVSGQQGAICEFGEIEWLSPDQVEVSARSGTYYLWKVEGHWQVFGYESGPGGGL